MSHFFGVTTHGYTHPIGSLVCPKILSEYHFRNVEPTKYFACDLGRTSAAFPDRDLRQADVMYGSNDGYSYGSNIRVSLMRRRSIPNAETPRDTYRLPPLTNMSYHWFYGDPELASGHDNQESDSFGQCEVAKRCYAAPRVAGLMNKEVDLVIRLQERGLITRAPNHADTQGPMGCVIPQGVAKLERSQRSTRDITGEKVTQRAPPEPEEASGEEKQTVGLPPEPREVCEEKKEPRKWFEHQHRHPQFYSAMTRFVETVRINDKMFEMY